MIGWEWLKSLPLNSKTYEITKIWNLSINAVNVWHSTNYHDIWSHLVLVGHRNSLWITRKQLKYMELLSNNTQNANTVPVYAVEAT